MDKVKALVEKGKDKTYSGYVDLDDDSLNYGIHGVGNTVDEAIDDFLISYREMKNHHKEIGRDFVEAEFEFIGEK